VNIAKICDGDVTGRVGIEFVKIPGKRLIIEQVKYLAAVKLDCVDEIHSVVQTGHERRFWRWADARAIPS
jgi:hypothetical protein